MAIVVERALLYARTARHLRWKQLWYRMVRRAQSRSPIPSGGAADVDPHRTALLSAEVRAWGPPDADSKSRADEVVSGRFRLLNHAELLPEIDWNRRYVSHLWSYNLHYFGYAVDLAWAFRDTGERRYLERLEELLRDWIEQTASGRGDGWEPYAVSLRVVNWIYSLLLVGDDLEEASRSLIHFSLVQQVRYLERRLEWHVQANHLLKNATALVVAGLYFSGRDAERWSGVGKRLLWRELSEQVLADGGHFERSPMYHAIVLADVLEVVRLHSSVGEDVSPAAIERVSRMIDAMGVLVDPTGRLHLFNDSAQGIAPSLGRLDALARRATGKAIPRPDGVMRLPDSGYFGYAHPERDERLLIDCGPIGPDHQPGHAHCDLLSFEWVVGGQPIVVNSGVHGYADDPFREYSRSTRAHNTVMIAGREQAEVWGSFRVARRPAVRGCEHMLSDREYRFSGAYRPYHERRAVHRRTLIREADSIEVVDRIEGVRDAEIVSFLHLHPSFHVRQEGGRYIAASAEMEVTIEPRGTSDVRLVTGQVAPRQGWYCPEFGVAMPAPAFTMTARSDTSVQLGYRIRVRPRIS